MKICLVLRMTSINTQSPPLGIKVIAHIPPEERASWAQHGIIGFYVGPAPEHYRCYQIYIPTTKGIRISDCL